MAIKFDKNYNAEIRRTVNNFNQKRNRAIKRGYHFLPPKLTVSELKKRYTTRSQLNRELTALRRFNKMGDKALKVVETSGGAKAIKWEYDYLKKNLKYAKAFYNREIAEASQMKTNMQVARAEYVNNLKAKRAFLDLELANLNQSEFRTYRKTIEGYLYANERDARAYRNWLNEIETIMTNLGYSKKEIDKFFVGFDKLTPRQFIELYNSSSIVSRIYELYIPTTDKSFKLSTTEEDARNLLDTFAEEKDELIAGIKKKAPLTEWEVEKILNDIQEQELEEKSKRKRRLKRSSLSSEQIKQLEDLGWEDLIED